MGWPQITYIALTAAGLGLALAKDGQVRTDRHSFGWSCVGSAVTYGLLYAGGFFG